MTCLRAACIIDYIKQAQNTFRKLLFLYRSEWQEFGLRSNEGMEEHAKRLAKTFSFRITDFEAPAMGGQAMPAHRRASSEAPATS